MTAPSRSRRSSARFVLGITVGASLLAVAGAASDRAHAPENVPSAIVVVDERGVVGLMRPDGTGFHRIGKSTLETEAPIDRPMLSPDGRKLLFFGGEGSLVVTGTDLSDPVAIAGDPGADRVYDAAWSPTGRQVAIESLQGAGAARIELVGVDGSNRHPIPGQPEDVQSPLQPDGPIAWSPDGSEVAFVTLLNGIDAIDVATGRTRTIVPPETGWTITGLAWSPGPAVAFSESLGDAQSRLREADRDGIARTIRTRDSVIAPSWSPDRVHLLGVDPNAGRILIGTAEAGLTRLVGPPGVAWAHWGGSSAQTPPTTPTTTAPTTGATTATTTGATTPATSSATTAAGPSATPAGGSGGSAGSPPARSAFSQSVLTPGQVGLSLGHLLTNALLALALVLVVAFVTEIFNSTFSANYERIVRPFARLRARYQGWSERARRRPGLSFATTMLAVSLLYCFLDPGFGWNQTSLATFLGMLAGLVIVTLTFDAVAVVYLRRRHAAWPSFRPYLAGIPIAVACVLLSRAAHFLPGYLLGAIAGFTFVMALSSAEEGRLAARSAVWMLGVSLVAWLVRSPVVNAEHNHITLGLQVLDQTLTAVVVAGVEGVAFGLIPIRFLEGEKVVAWNRRWWFAIFGVGVLAFVFLLVDPTEHLVGKTSVGPVWSMVALVGGFTLVTGALWLWFRLRPGDPSLGGPGGEHGVTQPTDG